MTLPLSHKPEFLGKALAMLNGVSLEVSIEGFASALYSLEIQILCELP